MDNTSHIDWLSFSLPTTYYRWEDLQPVMLSLFGLDIRNMTEPPPKASNWYRQHFVVRAPTTGKTLLHVYIEPTAKQNSNTTAFAVTGHALSSQPDALQHLNPVEIIRKVAQLSGHLTRLDLALDDFSGRPILSQMIDASSPNVWRDRIITPLRFSKPVAIWDESLYFGHLSKGLVICAYDKAVEQGIDTPWLRTEFRTSNRELLQSIALDLAGGAPVGRVTTELLSRYLKFVQPGLAAKYNRPICPWWTDYLGNAADYQFRRSSSGKTDDEPKPPPSRSAYLQYIRRGIEQDTTGELQAALLEYAEQLQRLKNF